MFGALKKSAKKFAYTFFLYLNFDVLLIFGAKTIPDFEQKIKETKY